MLTNNPQMSANICILCPQVAKNDRRGQIRQKSHDKSFYICFSHKLNTQNFKFRASAYFWLVLIFEYDAFFGLAYFWNFMVSKIWNNPKLKKSVL